MFVPSSNLLLDILQMDASEFFVPGKRIEGAGGNAAAKRFFRRSQTEVKRLLSTGELTAATSEKYMTKYIERFGHRADEMSAFFENAKASTNNRPFAVVSNALMQRRLASGIPQTRSNQKLLAEFRRLEVASLTLRFHLLYDEVLEWDPRSLGPSRFRGTETYEVFTSPVAIETWRQGAISVLHPCEFFVVGDFIQRVVKTRYLLSNLASQQTPSQVKTVFLEEYLLRNSQWSSKSEMWEAVPGDRIRSFAKKETAPKIDTFSQYIELVDMSHNPKVEHMSEAERRFINRKLQSGLFLVAVLCCLAIRMQNDWVHWQGVAGSEGFTFADMVEDFRALENGAGPSGPAP